MKPLQPAIKNLLAKKLVGKRVIMSLTENRTAELWKSFMIRRKEITNAVGSDLYSMQIYDQSYFEKFNPTAKFEKWATTEVSDFELVPPSMETFILPAGLYAVFFYKGDTRTGLQVFQYIFGTWLPQSRYLLDHRPHFEILGEKYKNGSPDSEEEIWIPVRVKT